MPKLEYLCLSRFEAYNFMRIQPYAHRIITKPSFKFVIARDMNAGTAAAQRKHFERLYPALGDRVVSDQGTPRVPCVRRQ